MTTRAWLCLTFAFVCILAADRSLAHAQAPDAARVAAIIPWLTPEAYSPAPTIADRSFWALVSQLPAYQSVVADAGKVPEAAFQPLPDDLYLEYSKNGNRSHYEQVYFEKLRAFRTLVVAECVENQGRFRQPIQQLIASYAADKSWVLPAHDGALDNFEGRQITIDLFASEVACELATADHILGACLDTATRAVVRDQVQRRIFQPYAQMVTQGQPSRAWLTVTNNWNAVCLANVTGTALALLDPPAERAFYVAAAEQYIAHFLRGFTADGYCSEGISYWNYGYGCFVRLGHMLDGATGGQVDLFARPRARSAGLFARRIEITPGVYPAFADCGVRAQPSRDYMAYVSRRYQLQPTNWERGGLESVRWLDEFGVFSFLIQKPDPTPPAAETPGIRDWFEDAGILICRGGQTRSGLPVGVALKGGHNAEHHNHNDLGSFVFCIGDSMTLVDPGAEAYTRRTFSSERYVSNLLNSFGHPVPRVAGQLQKTGNDAVAKLLQLDLADDHDTVQFDLSSAYPVPSLKQLHRTFVFQRDSGSLLVTDDVQFDTPETFGTAVITFEAWEQVSPDRLRVGAGPTAVEIQIDSGGQPLTIDAVTIDEDVRSGTQPTRIGIDLAAPVTQVTLRLTITPAAATP